TKEVLLKTNIYSLSFNYSDTIGKLINLEKGSYNIILKNKKDLTETIKSNDQIPRLKIDIPSMTKKIECIDFLK
ncbi:MAG: hypothetical protein J5672_00670, partial [Verrucomicrobia bacterium]|nr:hypothetical protein [Verrucomicrobiota bacterium]